MTDEELIARLRGKNCCESPSCNCDAAADRIEALVKQVDTMLTPEEAEKLVEMADPILSELLAVEAAYRKEAEAEVEKLRGALRLIELIGYREGEDFGWINAHMRGVATSILSDQSIDHYWRLFPNHRAALEGKANE